MRHPDPSGHGPNGRGPCRRGRRGASRSRCRPLHGEARPHRVRQHGAGLLPRRRRVRGGRRRPDRPQPPRSPASSTRRRSRRSSTRATPTSLLLLPRLCVSSEGAVDSIQLVSSTPLERIRTVAVTPESATSVVLTKVLLPDAEQVPLGEEAEATLLIGDAALKSAFEDPTPHHDLGRLWLERTGLPMVFAVWAAPEPLHPGLIELEDALVASVRAARADPASLAHEASERYGYPAGFLARYFEKLRYRFGPARARRAAHVPRARPRGRRAGRGARAALRHRGGDGLMATAPRAATTAILDKALDGERITDAEALALLESRDLVAVGRAANELRGRRTDPRPRHVHRRPQHQLHEHLRHRLRLLRLLPQPRRHARGLPAAEAGDLQEDRGDARARRHRRADAGRTPPRPRHRLLRGSLQLDQGALPDLPPRAVAAGDPAHRAPLEADRSPTRSRACATPGSTRSRAAAARCSSTASAR